MTVAVLVSVASMAMLRRLGIGNTNGWSALISTSTSILSKRQKEDFTTVTVSPELWGKALNVSVSHVYSDTYLEARTKFRQAAKAIKGAKLTSLAIVDNDNDYDLEDCTIDIVVKPGTTPGLTILSSGIHGIEGFAGSAIQIATLEVLAQQQQQQQVQQERLFPTLILIHSLNPHGMNRYRRVNEHNVDLNRNGLSQSDWDTYAIPQNGQDFFNKASYDKFSHAFNPAGSIETSGEQTTINRDEIPKPTWFRAYVTYFPKLLLYVMWYGIPTLKKALVSGQYHRQSGISYGGNGQLEQSYVVLEEWLSQFLQDYYDDPSVADKTQVPGITWIDVHTGLGTFGEDTMLPVGRDARARYPGGTAAMAKEFEKWYPDSHNPLRRSEDTTTSSSTETAKSVAQGYESVKGFLGDYFVPNLVKYCPKALVVVQEFGTLTGILVGHALMVENWAYHYYAHPTILKQLDTDEARADSLAKHLEWAKRTMRPTFYPDSDEWRYSVLYRGLQALGKSLHRSKESCSIPDT